MKKEPIFVIGTGRSGTSTLAGILYFLGVKMGKEFIPANDNNPIGYFENKDVLYAFRPVMRGQKGIDHVFQTIKDYAKGGHWGVKVPRLTDYIAQLVKEFPNAQYIVINRDKEKTINSMAKTMGLEKAIETYERRSDLIQSYIINNAEIDSVVIDIENINVDFIKQYIDIDSSDSEIERAKLYLDFTNRLSKLKYDKRT